MKYIGIDVGGTAIKAGLVDEQGNILVKDTIKTRAQESYEVLSKDIAELSKKIAQAGGCTLKDVESIGIGCPGSIDDKNGIVTYANNLNLLNAPIGAEVSKLTGLPVYLGNDANCAALGEFFALNDDNIQNFVAITLGTGVGGGIIINRQIYTGFNGAAGELGHIMLRADGQACTCGRNGCWEAYASATALIRETERAAKENPDSLLAELIRNNDGKANGKTAFDAAKKGDVTGKKIVDEYIKSVAEGLIDVINIFQPEVIVIGGGISKEGEGLINPICEYVNKFCYGGVSNIKRTQIRLAQLGNDAGTVGAALLGVR